MKTKIAVLAMIMCLVSSSVALARGNYHGHRGGYSGGHHYSSAHHDRAGVAFGVLGGLLLGSALIHAAAPPPPRVVYATPYPSYQPGVCFQDRVVSGQWQISGYDGRQIWVQFPSPVTQRFQVPCY